MSKELMRDVFIHGLGLGLIAGSVIGLFWADVVSPWIRKKLSK